MGKAAKVEAYGKEATGYSSIEQLASGGHGMSPAVRKPKKQGPSSSTTPRGVGMARNKPCKMY
jgi:hypothetical protein